jgi:predicted kinase
VYRLISLREFNVRSIQRSPTTLIVVSGLPASGKSTIADRVRSELGWPLLAKDAFKEMLFDTLGTGDRDWSRRLSKAAYALQFAQIGELIRSGTSCIAEGNFRWHEQHSAFEKLALQKIRVVQLHCRAEPEVLVSRFRERARTRHAGHVDAVSSQEIEREMLTTHQEPLPLPGETLICDTTGDWQRAMDASVEELVALLNRELSGSLSTHR